VRVDAEALGFVWKVGDRKSGGKKELGFFLLLRVSSSDLSRPLEKEKKELLFISHLHGESGEVVTMTHQEQLRSSS
jgi:hypothetical protein